jgi:hypothetical protein
MGEARKPWQSIAAANVGRFKRKSRKKIQCTPAEMGFAAFPVRLAENLALPIPPPTEKAGQRFPLIGPALASG